MAAGMVVTGVMVNRADRVVVVELPALCIAISKVL
jgi:hypothetical protein